MLDDSLRIVLSNHSYRLLVLRKLTIGALECWAYELMFMVGKDEMLMPVANPSRRLSAI